MSPLNKRLPRELLHNLGKYLGLFLLMTMAIAATSGFLVAASSIQRVQEEAPERYHVEDFHFVTQFEMKKSDISAVEELGGTLYKDYCSDVALSVPGNAEEMTVRLIEERDEVNLGYYFAGQPPAAADEIALDRCFCANNGLQVGDTLTVNGQEVTLTGIMSLSDYECLMEKNTDMIFNALTFTVSQVTPEGFRALAAGKVDYRYDMVLDDRALSSEEDVLCNRQERNKRDLLMDKCNTQLLSLMDGIDIDLLAIHLYGSLVLLVDTAEAVHQG